MPIDENPSTAILAKLKFFSAIFELDKLVRAFFEKGSLTEGAYKM